MIMEEGKEIPPSAFGFRSILPRTRYERLSLKDKVTLERNRINQRVGWQARMHQKNAPDSSAMLTSLNPGAAGYLANSDRFHTDTVGEEFSHRQQQYQRKLAADDFRRGMAAKRDEDRWNTAEERQKEEEERWHKLRDDGSKAQKNQSLVAYDILTLQYSEKVEGEQQKYVDEMVRYRANLRTNNLIEKGDTRVGYNIISGAERPSLRNPAPVAKPLSLQQSQPNISPRVDRRMSLQPNFG